jgi:outer membrane lipoprotein SlyB
MENKNQNLQQQDSQQQDSAEEKSKKWWKWFWITIIILAIVYIGLQVLATNKISNLSLKDRKAVTAELISDFQKKYPQLINIISQLPDEYKEKMKKSINDNVDKAYSNVYDHIDDFADFHYSVTGEYTEIATELFGDINNILMKKVFEPADFENNLNKALSNINSETNNILKDYYSKIKDKIKSKLNINENEANFLLNDILKLSQENMKARFHNSLYNSFRAFGIGGGAAAAVVTKVVSKKIASVLAKKIAVKAATKAGAKVGGAAAGAAAGAGEGLLCGPGAWLCSPAGAVVGGIVGWFATDKIVVEVDKYFNKDEFKQELRKLIDQQKEATKQTLYKIYLGSFDEMNKVNKEKFEEIKNKSVKDIIK